jgi:adenylate kinase
MMNIILFGPPGSGKGTQSIKIAEKYDLVHISTGDIFRAELKEETPLGLKAKSFMEKGELVPDELLADIIRSAMDKHGKSAGYIFDGYPRTIPQAEDLDRLMKERGASITHVLALEVSDQEVITRLLKRAELEGRSDDNEEVIANRLNVYKEQTQPLINFYDGKGLFTGINGVGSIDEIFENLCKVIDI